MSRSLSGSAAAALFSQETAEAFIVLLEISGTGITTLRLANNLENVTSGGNTYTAFPFQVILPHEREDQVGRLRLIIDNVDRQLVTAIRTLGTAPTITVKVVLASSPNTIEATFGGFTLRNTGYDALAVEGDLEMEDVANEGFPALSFTPNLAPALF